MANKYKKKENGKNDTGRPTKYKDEYCQVMIDFFDAEPFTDIEIPHYKDGKIVWNDIKRMPNKLPTMIEFVKHLNKKIKKKEERVCYSTVYDWLDEKEGAFQIKFLQTFTRIAKALQKNNLLQNALQGLYNPLFAKFAAINITDWTDKKEVGHSGAIQINITQAQAKAKRASNNRLQEQLN